MWQFKQRANMIFCFKLGQNCFRDVRTFGSIVCEALKNSLRRGRRTSKNDQEQSGNSTIRYDRIAVYAVEMWFNIQKAFCERLCLCKICWTNFRRRRQNGKWKKSIAAENVVGQRPTKTIFDQNLFS